MYRNFIKNYVENIPVYFKDKKKNNFSIFNIYNRFLKFPKCSTISKNKNHLNFYYFEVIKTVP